MEMDQLTAALSEGVDIPLLGLGTWQARGKAAYWAVRTALDLGYRHLDTATMYRNERSVGEALKDSGVPRDEVFVTTKLPAEDAGQERQSLEAGLGQLGVDHVDLWLIHWPLGGARPDVWERFIEARRDGLARAIGVSNYSLSQIDELTEATGVTPQVNQIRWHVERYDAAELSGHVGRGVLLEGWAPFKHTDMSASPLAEAAATHAKTAQQVVLRWHLQHGIAVIPKSTHKDRIAANFDVFDFELSDIEMGRIDALG
jgi:2,5-diketo-D-gluconate reductase A